MTLVYSLAKKGAGCMTTWLIDKDIVKAVVIFLFDEIFFLLHSFLHWPRS